MTGLFVKKYHIAVFGEDKNFVTNIMYSLKEWYSNKVVVESYTDSYKMFEAINISEMKNSPFDLAVFNMTGVAQKMILKQTNPAVKVFLCSNGDALKKETDKILV